MRADKSRAATPIRAFSRCVPDTPTSFRRILVVGSDGTYATDSQPLARFNIFCLAKEGTNTSRGSAGGGGRVGIEYFQTEKTPEHFAKEAAPRPSSNSTRAKLRRRDGSRSRARLAWHSPARSHRTRLEADFNRKKTSAFARMLGKRVASENAPSSTTGLCLACGSINVDDEATLLRTPCSSRRGSSRDTQRQTFRAAHEYWQHGNGRPESYEHYPCPHDQHVLLSGEDSQ